MEKSGGFGKTPWVNAKISTKHADGGVEDRLDEEGCGDRRVARAGDRGAREEQLDHVAAARGDDVVEADGREVGAPDPPPLEHGGRIGGAQAVEEGARAQRQVEAEEQQAEQQQAPVDGGQVGEELADSVEERGDAVADRGRGEQGGHHPSVRVGRYGLGRAEPRLARRRTGARQPAVHAGPSIYRAGLRRTPDPLSSARGAQYGYALRVKRRAVVALWPS